jgi:hypothetical protein
MRPTSRVAHGSQNNAGIESGIDLATCCPQVDVGVQSDRACRGHQMQAVIWLVHLGLGLALIPLRSKA